VIPECCQGIKYSFSFAVWQQVEKSRSTGMKPNQFMEPRIGVKYVVPILGCAVALFLGRFLAGAANPWTALILGVEAILLLFAFINPRLGVYLCLAACAYSDLSKRLTILFGPVEGIDVVISLAAAPSLFVATLAGTFFLQIAYVRKGLTKAQLIMFVTCAVIAALNLIRSKDSGGVAASAQVFIGSSLYYFFIPLVSMLFREREDLQRLLRFSAYLFAPVAIYGIWQTIFGFLPFERKYLETGFTMMIGELADAHPRPFSTLASPHPFGVCMAILACVCAFVPMQGTTKRWWEYALAILFVAGCIASFARAAWFILIFAFVGWVCYRQKVTSLLYYGALTALFVLLFANADFMMDHLETAQDLLPTTTAREKEAFNLGTFGTRLWSFRNAVKNPAFHTWFGNPQIMKDFQSGEGNIEEAAHDQLTQILAAYGFVGVLAFVSILVGMLWTVHSRTFRLRQGFRRRAAIGLVSTLAGVIWSGMVFGQHLNVFPVNALFSMAVGILFVLILNNETQPDKTSPRGATASPVTTS
jgi:hypothetical protein